MKGCAEKKGQNWSFEITFVLGVFIVILIFSVVYLSYFPESSTEAFRAESEQIGLVLDEEIGLFEGQNLNEDALEELDDLDSSELGEVTGSTSDVCIYILDSDGNLVPLPNGNSGVGVDASNTCGG